MEEARALAWRDKNRTTDPVLRDAMQRWQANPSSMQHVMKMVVAMPPDVLHAMVTLKEAMEVAPELPIGTVLWHAAPTGSQVDTDGWLPTAATLDGARAYAAKHIFTQVTYYRLKVVTAGIRAITIDVDADYEYEKEVLVMEHVQMNLDHEAAADEGNTQLPIERWGMSAP